MKAQVKYNGNNQTHCSDDGGDVNDQLRVFLIEKNTRRRSLMIKIGYRQGIVVR